MKRKFLAVSILFLIFACDSPSARIETSVEVPVVVEEVSSKRIEEFVETTGTVSAAKETILKSEQQGYYRLADNPSTSRPFELGDKVKKGQIIIYLENPEQENTIKIESHKLALQNSEREFEKQQSLYKKGGVTLGELNDAERSFVDAKYSFENAKIQLAKLKVTAPFAGVIVDIPYYTQGVLVPSNSDMVQLMDFNTLKMDIKLPDKLLGKIKVKQSVRIMNYKSPDKKLKAEIVQVSPALDSETRTFKAALDIDNKDWFLRPGMFVKAEIVTASTDTAIVISKDVILTRRNRKTVFVVNQGFARERRITTGLENPEEVEVTKGLRKKERLIIKGFETLINGSKVKISTDGTN